MRHNQSHDEYATQTGSTLNSPAPKIRVALLDEFRLSRGHDAARITIKSKRARALVAVLALHLDRPISRSRIAGLLWPEQPEVTGRQSLRQILTELRTEIGPEFDQGVTKDSVQLHAQHFEVDAVEFSALSRTPASHERAVSLYAGDLTTDFDIKSTEFQDWLMAERRKLHNLAIETFDSYSKALAEKGEQRRALAVCEALLALDPLRESTHRLLLTLDSAVNGRASALARAHTLKIMLSGELGVSPEPATMQVIESLSAPTEHSTPAPARSSSTGGVADPTRSRSRGYIGYALAIGLLVILGGILWQSGVLKDEPTKPQAQLSPTRLSNLLKNADTTHSLAILPFTVRTDSIQAKQLAKALEEDIVDSLSRAPRFLVISHQTARTYRDTDKDARQIGRELNVKFLASGSFELNGTQFIVRAQLIDTESGLLAWSDRFVFSNQSTQEAQEEIVLGIARTLQVQVVFTEATKRTRLERENPTYGDLVERGWAAAFNSFTRFEAIEESISLFEQAMALNPNHATARIGLAAILTRRTAEFRSPDRTKDIMRAEALLTAVINEHPENSAAFLFLGIARKQQGRYADSIVQFEKSIKLNPSNAHAYAQLGQSLIFLGRAAEAHPYIEKALRLSPKDPTISSWYFFMAQAHLHKEEYDHAINWLKLSLEVQPRSGRTLLFLATARMLKGEKEPAAQAAKQALLLLPNFNVDKLQGPDGDADVSYLAGRKRMRDAMRQALDLASQ